jgi:hypothetical protein
MAKAMLAERKPAPDRDTPATQRFAPTPPLSSRKSLAYPSYRRYVYVRSRERYSAATNALLLTTEPERRVVPLDLFLLADRQHQGEDLPTCQASLRRPG